MLTKREHRWSPQKPQRQPSARACLSLRRVGMRGATASGVAIVGLAALRGALGPVEGAAGIALVVALLVLSVVTAVCFTTSWAAKELAIGARWNPIGWLGALAMVWVIIAIATFGALLLRDVAAGRSY